MWPGAEMELKPLLHGLGYAQIPPLAPTTTNPTQGVLDPIALAMDDWRLKDGVPLVYSLHSFWPFSHESVSQVVPVDY
jgi:hypothetical protein